MNQSVTMCERAAARLRHSRAPLPLNFAAAHSINDGPDRFLLPLFFCPGITQRNHAVEHWRAGSRILRIGAEVAQALKLITRVRRGVREARLQLAAGQR